MKILLLSDNHWSQYSSIIRRRHDRFSARLDNQIESLNWAFNLAEQKSCGLIVHLGDFFDKAELNAEEITALDNINWPSIDMYFIAGNHEMASVYHDFSSVKLFDLLKNGSVFIEPKIVDIDNIELGILPYILESERKPIEEYFPKTDKKRIILSHNDISGIQMGQFISKNGFSIEEIENNCDYFMNGHLHNGQKISNKIFNIGNLTGQNFSEDAFKYEHVVFIVDTETLSIEVYENPYAYNFYKIDITINGISSLNNLKPNSVVTVKCCEDDYDSVKQQVSNTPNIVESRIIMQYNTLSALDNVGSVEELSVNHLDEFEKYVLSNIGDTESIREELMAVRA